MTNNAIIEFYSDYNCPFCYALNERLIALGDSHRIQWRGIEHEASATSRVVTLDEKNQLLNEVTVIRKRAPEITIVTPPFRPSTRLPNRVTFAIKDQDQKNLSDFRTLLYRAYWVEGKDISDSAVLKQIASSVNLEYPSEDDINKPMPELDLWQESWMGDRFKTRLPALLSTDIDKPIMGFPTYDLLSNFFNGLKLPVAPDSLAACQLKPRQTILMVGQFDHNRCNMIELESAYNIVRIKIIEKAIQWLGKVDCPPDVILIHQRSTGRDGIMFCSRLKRDHEYRHTSVMFLMDKQNTEIEMEAFDVGAADVVFDLSNPKITQARLDAQLRNKQSASILDALCRLDYLTELPNRRDFDRKLEEEWLRATRTHSPLSVILIDIDHFKLFNDNYGHTAGDDCLRACAKIMATCIKRTADVLARYGGEEFAAVLPDTDQQGAINLAKLLCKSVEAEGIPHAKSLVSDKVTISAGVATMIPNQKYMPEKLLECADEALYQSKQQGRNQASFFQE